MLKLKTENLVSGYGKTMIIQDVSIEVESGRIISIIGRNGVGKSTLLKTIIGLIKPASGKIFMDDEDMTTLASHQRAKIGMGYVPQGHGVFSQLSVEENLKLGGLINANMERTEFDDIYEYFPRLAERRKQKAGTLSGGERAMLSIGRVLVGKPKILLMDEPSEGVQPNLVQMIGEVTKKITSELGISVLLVEQNIRLIEQVSQEGYAMDNGRIVAKLSADEIVDEETIKKYVSV